MSLHDYLKELSWSNHRLLVCCHLQQCSTSQLYSSLLLRFWGETFLATDRSWWSSAEERTWAGMDPHVLCQMQAFFSCPGPVMPHSACMSHSGLCLIRTLKLLCSISLLGKNDLLAPQVLKYISTETTGFLNSAHFSFKSIWVGLSLFHALNFQI